MPSTTTLPATTLAAPVSHATSPKARSTNLKRRHLFSNDEVPVKRPRTRSFTAAAMITPPSSPPVSKTAPPKRLSIKARAQLGSTEPLYLMKAPKWTKSSGLTEQDTQYTDSFNKDPICEDRFEVFKSESTGYGLRAKKDLPEGTFVGKYTGKLITKEHSDVVESYYRNNGMQQCYLWSLCGGCVVDATNIGNKTRFINHSCKPNCKSTEQGVNLRIYTNCLIPKGTELTIDYDFPEEPGKDRIRCLCSSDNCKGFIN